MLRLGGAAGDAHEFVKLEHAALAARPTFASFVEEGLAGMVNTLLLAPILAGFVHAAAAFALAGCLVGHGGVFGIALIFGRRGSACARRTGRLSCYGLARDGWWEVAGVFGLLRRLGLNLGFDFGGGRFLLGGSGSVVDGGVLTFCTGSDGQELVEGQDACFAAAVALLAFMEDGNASCWCVSGVIAGGGLLCAGDLDERW